MPHDTLQRDGIIRKALGETHKRSFTIEHADAVESDSRTVEMAFASDRPCEHFSYRLYDFIDVKLSMEKRAMRTERLTSGAALLADHDPRDQIGVVESFSVDTRDGKARAKVRFSKSARGQEIYQDVIDGIRRNVSVGFSIHKLVLEEENEDGNDLYRADDWEPFELSIVSIPADISVGVGRSAEFTRSTTNNAAADIEFIDKMIEHHEMAISMVRQYIGRFVHSELTELGQNIITAQSAEIEQMRRWKSEWTENAPSGETKTMSTKTMSDNTDNQLVSPAIGPTNDDEKLRAAKEVIERNTEEIKLIRNDQEIIEWAEIFGKGEMARQMLLQSRNITLDDVRAKINWELAREKEIAKRVSPVKQASAETSTLGSAFIVSNEYRAIERGANQEYKIKVDTNILPSQLGRAYSGSGDGLTGYDRVPGIVELGQQRPMVADLFMQGQTDQNTVRYLKETSYTNGADTVAEGDDKPEAAFVLEEIDAAVRKVAVWTKVTDETLEDFSQIRPYIDQRLGFMVRSKIDNQLLNGSGTAPNLAGLLGTSGVQTAEMTSNTPLEFAKTVLNAITKVRSTDGAFFEPDAIVMHPNDYEKLRSAVDGNSQFYGGGYFQGQYGTPYNDPNFMWGLRVVQTTAISELNLATPGASNKGPIIGDFKNGGAVHYRNGLSIAATNTDQDDFIMNLTTIRVEQRLALAVYSPLAFCRVINAS